MAFKLIVLLHVGETCSYTNLQRYLNIIALRAQLPLAFLWQSTIGVAQNCDKARLYKCCCNKFAILPVLRR
ncbi:Uncharacterised protein [Serratia fonticola]|uniref:Uncharacterized protein n=1 Tax=Serratia fonticola TaxID=47917 RepID=A0A4U9VVF7_SERFO|nr:Uncharacterised protein [Serratia fonticola]